MAGLNTSHRILLLFTLKVIEKSGINADEIEILVLQPKRNHSTLG